MTDLKVEQAVEDICELGCRKVHKVIAELSSRQSSPLTSHYNPDQRRAILDELTEIMSFYDTPCDINN